MTFKYWPIINNSISKYTDFFRPSTYVLPKVVYTFVSIYLSCKYRKLTIYHELIFSVLLHAISSTD